MDAARKRGRRRRRFRWPQGDKLFFEYRAASLAAPLCRMTIALKILPITRNYLLIVYTMDCSFCARTKLQTKLYVSKVNGTRERNNVFLFFF